LTSVTTSSREHSVARSTSTTLTTGLFVEPVNAHGQPMKPAVFAGIAQGRPTFEDGMLLASKEGVIVTGERVLVSAAKINPRARQLVIPPAEQRTTLGTGWLASGH